MCNNMLSPMVPLYPIGSQPLVDNPFRRIQTCPRGEYRHVPAASTDMPLPRVQTCPMSLACQFTCLRTCPCTWHRHMPPVSTHVNGGAAFFCKGRCQVPSHGRVETNAHTIVHTNVYAHVCTHACTHVHNHVYDVYIHANHMPLTW